MIRDPTGDSSIVLGALIFSVRERKEYSGYSTSNINFDKSELLQSHSWFKSVLNNTAAFTSYLATQTGRLLVRAATEINSSFLPTLEGNHIACVVEQILTKKKKSEHLIVQYSKPQNSLKLQLTEKKEELLKSQLSLACYYPSLPSSSQ